LINVTEGRTLEAVNAFLITVIIYVILQAVIMIPWQWVTAEVTIDRLSERK